MVELCVRCGDIVHRWSFHLVVNQFHQRPKQTIKRKGRFMKISSILAVSIACKMTLLVNTSEGSVDINTIHKLESTAKKLRTAKIFLSDDKIKARVKRSMRVDVEKWNKAREEYKQVLETLKTMNIKVNVPDTLDQLMYERADKDADKVLMSLAGMVRSINKKS